MDFVRRRVARRLRLLDADWVHFSSPVGYGAADTEALYRNVIRVIVSEGNAAVWVSGLSRQQLRIPAIPVMPVGNLHTRVAARFELLPGSFWLSFQGRPLSGQATLHDFGIPMGGQVYGQRRVRGGGSQRMSKEERDEEQHRWTSTIPSTEAPDARILEWLLAKPPVGPSELVWRSHANAELKQLVDLFAKRAVKIRCVDDDDQGPPLLFKRADHYFKRGPCGKCFWHTPDAMFEHLLNDKHMSQCHKHLARKHVQWHERVHEQMLFVLESIRAFLAGGEKYQDGLDGRD